MSLKSLEIERSKEVCIKQNRLQFQPGFVTNCILCRGSSFTLFQKKSAYNIIKCKNCSMVSLDYTLSIDAAKNLYSEPYYKNNEGAWITTGYPDYFAMEEAFKKTFSERLNRIVQISWGGRLLDVGCGPGFFLEVAKKHFDVTGVEVSDFAASYGSEHLNLRIFNQPIEVCDFANDEFDVITMWDTIEHLINPMETLQEVNRILKKGGLFVVQTGNVESVIAKIMGKRWHLYNVPEHLFFFSTETLKALLDKTGFSIRKVKTELSYYNAAYLLDRLARSVGCSKSYRKQEAFLSKLCVPLSLFDIITVYAYNKE